MIIKNNEINMNEKQHEDLREKKIIRKSLGRGLDSILPEFLGEKNLKNSSVTSVPISMIVPGSQQARQRFSEDSIMELSQSMKEYGILQPIVVRPHAGGKYEIIAGERRWRAAQQAGITEIPVIIRHVSGKQAQEINLIENIQREDLNPIETAEALKRLIEEYGYTQQDIAEKICKNRSSVANTLRLLDLPLPVREMVRTGKITEGHGRALLGLKENSAIVKMANLIAEKNLSVREVEKRVSALNKKNTGEIETKKKFKILPEIKELCQRLQRKLGTKVELKHTNKGNGKMEIYYRSLDELERILALIFKK